MGLRDYEDVEIFIRRPGVEKGSERERVFYGSYRDVAKLTSRTIIELFGDDYYALGEGEWVIGIRERGDEQVSRRVFIDEFAAEEAPTVELQNTIAALLNHWRE